MLFRSDLSGEKFRYVVNMEDIPQCVYGDVLNYVWGSMYGRPDETNLTIDSGYCTFYRGLFPVCYTCKAWIGRLL